MRRVNVIFAIAFFSACSSTSTWRARITTNHNDIKMNAFTMKLARVASSAALAITLSSCSSLRESQVELAACNDAGCATCPTTRSPRADLAMAYLDEAAPDGVITEGTGNADVPDEVRDFLKAMHVEHGLVPTEVTQESRIEWMDPTHSTPLLEVTGGLLVALAGLLI